MLTGDLLVFRFRSGNFRIRFVDPDDPDLLLSAERLTACFTRAAQCRLTRKELEEELELFRRSGEKKITDGLVKLLTDRTEFVSPQDTDLPALRRKVFAAASDALDSCAGNFDAYREKMEQIVRGSDVYGDLPGSERIKNFSPLKTRELLERYDLALAQGMLFYAEKLTLKVSDPEPAELRRMLKYMKFFRLLAEVISARDSSLEIEMSGPFSLFGPTRKYALNLAVFLPAAVRLKHWSVDASLDVGGRKGALHLDDSAGLVSHYRNFSAYVPEEVKMFHKLFAEKSKTWKIVGDTPIIQAGPQDLIVPDLSFAGPSGKVVHLELFHRWHKVQLDRRLETLKKKELPLIAGIDRSLMDSSAFDALLEHSPALARHLFLFSGFPGVETTLRMLARSTAPRS
ncbi:MAG: DUF790 family protein [Lentisphaeria bacterium]|nr:DUF790 family protein [Lentisphaeria bacterium]